MTLTFDLLTSKSIGHILDSWRVCMWSFMMIGVKGKQLCAGNPNAAGQTDGRTWWFQYTPLTSLRGYNYLHLHVMHMHRIDCEMVIFHCLDWSSWSWSSLSLNGFRHLCCRWNIPISLYQEVNFLYPLTLSTLRSPVTIEPGDIFVRGSELCLLQA